MELESKVEETVKSLVGRVKSGGADAFEDLYRRFGPSVHAVLLSKLPLDEAEELTQEVFLTAHRKLVELADLALFGPWIHAVARNAATDRLRARARRPKPEPLPEIAAPPASEDELRQRVLWHVQKLPEAYRETLLMRLVEGLTGPEIAERIGLTAASVRVNLSRGMDLLRQALRKEGWP